MLRVGDEQISWLKTAFSSHRAVRTIVLLFFFLLLGLRYGDYLFVVRNYSFFPLFKSAFWEIVSEPGGALELGAIFLAETFESAWLGALLLALLADVTSRAAFSLWRVPGRRCDKLFLLSLIPGFLAIALFLGVGINVFESNHGTFYLEPLIGVLTILTLLLICRSFHNERFRWCIAFGSALLAYPLVGVYAIMFAVLFLLEEFKRIVRVHGRFTLTQKRFLLIGALLVFSAFLPILWGAFAWQVYDAQRLYRAALFEETTVSIDAATCLRLDILLGALGVVLIVGEIASLCAIVIVRDEKLEAEKVELEEANSETTGRKGKKARRERMPRRKCRRSVKKERDNATGAETCECENNVAATKRRRVWRAYAFVLLLGAGTLLISPHEENFMASTALMKPLYERDWKRVIEIEAKLREPSETAIMLRRLAYFNIGGIAEHLFDRPVVPKMTPQLALVGPQRVYGAYALDFWGFSNLAARIATNNYVATRGRSIPAIKAIVYTAYDRHDYEFAERYLARVEHSLVLSDRSFRDTCLKYRDEEYWDEFWILPTNDYIETGLESVDAIVANGMARRPDLARFRVYDDPRKGLLETRLAYALLYRDFDVFINELDDYLRALNDYGKRNGKYELPRAFQEAVLFFEHLKKIERGKYKIDPERRNNFEEFTKYLELYRQTRDAKLLEGIRDEYGDTAWYYFIFQGVDEAR